MHLQAWGDTVQKLSSVAFDLAGINPKKVVVKLPCTLEGIQTAALLRDANIRLSMTGLASGVQVVPCMHAGAEYATPFLGRMKDRVGSEKVRCGAGDTVSHIALSQFHRCISSELRPAVCCRGWRSSF